MGNPNVGSRPVWGAWIEILWGVTDLAAQIKSRPVWGAWIEIGNDRVSLKGTIVAPRMGRVD